MNTSPTPARDGVVAAGTWVEVERVLLAPEQRSSALPEETRTCPYVLRMSGFLAADAEEGTDVTITSLIGRTHSGKLVRVNPSYHHTFGETVPELLHIGLGDDDSLPGNWHDAPRTDGGDAVNAAGDQLSQPSAAEGSAK